MVTYSHERTLKLFLCYVSPSGPPGQQTYGNIVTTQPIAIVVDDVVPLCQVSSLSMYEKTKKFVLSTARKIGIRVHAY